MYNVLEVCTLESECSIHHVVNCDERNYQLELNTKWRQFD